MVRSPVGRVLALVLVLLAVLALVVGAYNVGVSAGVASAGTAVTGVPHAWGYAFAGGYGFPVLLFWPIFPILFIVFVALLLRAVVWGRGPWGGRSWGPGTPGSDHWHDTRMADGPPARFEEWHRRAHAGEGPETASPGAAPADRA